MLHIAWGLVSRLNFFRFDADLIDPDWHTSQYLMTPLEYMEKYKYFIIQK